ncbi:MAG: hypothetical protein HC818_05610 [Synechococcaceae cyanobacterium RM1_1_27]|nr:hypothetical protein [Synechococcaceae cyanobacterium RM1_1_27]
MDANVIWVCALNVVLVLGILRAIPIVWGLRRTFSGTASTFDGWSEATHASLGSTPQALLQLRDGLRQSRKTLSSSKQWLQWIGGLTQIGRWF